MKKTINIIVLFLLLMVQLKIVAQPSPDEQLADQFYKNREFDKALDYYERLYNRKSPDQFYLPYLNCLIETKDFKKAEKIVKKQIKQYPDNLTFCADLGTVYNRSEQPDKAKRCRRLPACA